MSKEFVDAILHKLRDDPVGKLAKSERYILYLGQKYFNIRRYKTKKIRNVRKSTRSEMRLLASLYLAFNDLEGRKVIDGSLLDMFLRENFDDLLVAVDALTLETIHKMKAGTRHSIFFTLFGDLQKISVTFYF